MVRFLVRLAALGIGARRTSPPNPTDRSAPDSVRSTPRPSCSSKPLGWNDHLRAREALDFAAGEARLSLGHPFVQFGSEVAQAGDSLLGAQPGLRHRLRARRVLLAGASHGTGCTSR
jgi:hypothetical protein